MPEPVEPTKWFSPYSGFLIDKLNKIYDAWDEGNSVLALGRAYKLYFFLQTDLKEVLTKRMKELVERVEKVRHVNGSGFFSTQKARNRTMKSIASDLLPGFVDELVKMLDKKQFLGEVRRHIPEGHE